MRHLLSVLTAIALTSPASAQSAGAGPRAGEAAARSTATVYGQVRSERSGAPLRMAVIELVVAGQKLTAVTDSLGVYVLRDVPEGRRLLRATHIDHAPNEAELVLVGGYQHALDFDLEFRPLRLTPVEALTGRRNSVAAALDTAKVSDSALGAASVRVLESTPGVAELGLAEAASEIPGHEPVDPTDVLYVRGGAADLKLVLLNGAPVYAPFHIGGLIQALDAEILRSAALYVGGAPARYDGGLSYVMDLETRSARTSGRHVRLAADMMSASALFEGPLPGHGSLLVSGRLVHGQGTADWIGDPFPYAYGDGLARLDVPLGSEHLITVTGFRNRERVSLDTLGGDRQKATWGNDAGSLRYRGRAFGHDVMGTVAAGRFRTTLPLGGIRPLMTEGTATRLRVGADLERPLGPVRLGWGASFDRIEFEYRAFPQNRSRDEIVAGSRADGDIAGVYAELAAAVHPRLRIRAGARADVFSNQPELRLAPRASATLLLTDRAALTLAAGRYRQYVRAEPQALVFLGNVVADSSGGPPLTVAEAAHLVLGVSQDLGEGMQFGVEGYFKQFDGLHFERAKRTESSGVDLWVRRGTGAITGWLGYSLGWVWTVEDERPRPTQSFSGRHLVSAGLVGPIVGGGRFDLRVSYGAGLPYTAIPEPEDAAPSFGVGQRPSLSELNTVSDAASLPSEPQDPYIRVDAQVQRTWAGRWRGFDFELTPYARVINALNRRDAIFYHYNREVGSAEPLAGLPLVPILGLEWKF